MSGIKSFYINKGFTRREALGLAGALALSQALPAWASDEIGEVIDAKGEVMKTQNDIETAIKTGASLINNDLIATGTKSFASMLLGSETKIIMST